MSKSKPDGAPSSSPSRRCLACGGIPLPLVRYEHDGKVDDFHPVCVGSWLMSNPDTVISFFMGEGEAPA
jgi:hypothetical protein